MNIQWSPCWLFLLVTLSVLVRQSGLVAADADYESVRIRFDYPYMGGRGGDPKAKYWRKSGRLIGRLRTNIFASIRRVNVSDVLVLV